MWGVTGAAFYLPPVKDAWLAVTGGAAADPQKYSVTTHDAAPGDPEIGIDQAAAAALAQTPGEIRYLTTPQGGYYSVSIAGEGYQPYGARAFFGGDHTVYVDSHDATHVSDVDANPSGARTSSTTGSSGPLTSAGSSAAGGGPSGSSSASRRWR